MSEIKKMTDTELRNSLAEKRDVIRKARFSSAGAQSSDASKVRSAKKEIARTLTEINTRIRALKKDSVADEK